MNGQEITVQVLNRHSFLFHSSHRFSFVMCKKHTFASCFSFRERKRKKNTERYKNDKHLTRAFYICCFRIFCSNIFFKNGNWMTHTHDNGYLDYNFCRMFTNHFCSTLQFISILELCVWCCGCVRAFSWIFVFFFFSSYSQRF